jgi:hypothetical protein
MIEFRFQLRKRYAEWHDDKNHHNMEYEGEFDILINGETFFHDDFFVIYEFLEVALAWSRSVNDQCLYYNCIDTDDNPLISFVPIKNDGWQMFSPWQRYRCNHLFSKKELARAVENLNAQVETACRMKYT